MSTFDAILALACAAGVVFHAGAYWTNILASSATDKVLCAAFVVVGVAHFFVGNPFVSGLLLLIAMLSISEMNLKARVRALGGEV